jgi:hypothetical protein
MAHFANGLLGHLRDVESAKGEEKKRDVIVVTLVRALLRLGDIERRLISGKSQDQRNHGDRTHEKAANLSFEDGNLNYLYARFKSSNALR